MKRLLASWHRHCRFSLKSQKRTTLFFLPHLECIPEFVPNLYHFHVQKLKLSDGSVDLVPSSGDVVGKNNQVNAHAEPFDGIAHRREGHFGGRTWGFGDTG